VRSWATSETSPSSMNSRSSSPTRRKVAPADADQVLLGDNRGRGDPAAIDESAIVAAQIHDLEPRRPPMFRSSACYPGNAEIRHDQVISRRPANSHEAGPAARMTRGGAGRSTLLPPPAREAFRSSAATRAHHDRAIIEGWPSRSTQFCEISILPIRPRTQEGPVGAARILEDPGIPVHPEHRVFPGHPGVTDHDVGLRIAADAVVRASAPASGRIPRSSPRVPGLPAGRRDARSILPQPKSIHGTVMWMGPVSRPRKISPNGGRRCHRACDLSPEYPKLNLPASMPRQLAECKARASPGGMALPGGRSGRARRWRCGERTDPPGQLAHSRVAPGSPGTGSMSRSAAAAWRWSIPRLRPATGAAGRAQDPGPGPWAQDQGFQQRFIRESRAAAAVDHPNIIPVFAAGEADGRAVHRDALRRGAPTCGPLIETQGPRPAGQVIEIVGPGGVRAGRGARAGPGAPRRQARQHAA